MKIAIVIEKLTNGGAERFTSILANYMADKNEHVTLITMKKECNEYLLNTSINRMEMLLGSRFLFRDVYEVVKYIKQNSFDCIIGIGIYGNIVCCMSRLFIDRKIIISERNDPYHDLLSWKSKFLRFIFYRFSDGYVFQTEGAKSFYSNKIQNKSIVIHNPIKPDLPHRNKNPKKEIVAVGRLVPQKNYPVLLKAFSLVHKNHPDYILKIYGEGILLEELRDLSRQLGIDDFVFFEGFCSDVHEQISNSDIFVMSSDYEGMPNSLMEAMAMGFPVVCTDCPSGGPSELIINGYNGILCLNDNVISLFDGLNLLICDSNYKEKLGDEAKGIVNNHNVRFIISKWENYISKIIFL